MFCREQAVQLHRELPEIRRRGAELAFVGNGNRHFAATFKQELGLETPLFVDTRRDAYRALGMKRSLRRTLFAPRVWANGRWWSTPWAPAGRSLSAGGCPISPGLSCRWRPRRRTGACRLPPEPWSASLLPRESP